MYNKKEIIELILEQKLFCDKGVFNNGSLYEEKYTPYVSFDSGLWQDPDEFAELLLYLQDKDIKTFLNIGTFNGVTFNFLSDFLNKKNKCKCITIDPYNHNPIKDSRFYYYDHTSEKYINTKFDLVFIDGNHAYDYVKLDYENVGQYSNFVVFHDINDDVIRKIEQGGGVPIFWDEIKENKNYIEIINKNKKINTMGIGIINWE